MHQVALVFNYTETKAERLKEKNQTCDKTMEDNNLLYLFPTAFLLQLGCRCTNWDRVNLGMLKRLITKYSARDYNIMSAVYTSHIIIPAT